MILHGLFIAYIREGLFYANACKFVKRYLDEFNLHGLPWILQGVKLMTDHNNVFLQAEITLFDKEVKSESANW